MGRCKTSCRIFNKTSKNQLDVKSTTLFKFFDQSIMFLLLSDFLGQKAQPTLRQFINLITFYNAMVL